MQIGNTIKLRDGLPELYKEIEGLFKKKCLDDLLQQLPNLEISGRCSCGDDFCSTFNIKPTRELNIVEKNIIGVKNEKTIDLDAESGYIIVDIDNFGRIIDFEVLYRKDVSDALDRIGLRGTKRS